MIDESVKKLSVKTSSNDDKIVIYDSLLEGWDIIVEVSTDQDSNRNYLANHSRHDDALLTGTLTFMDSIFERINILVSGALHEDALNIVRSKGDISSIIIKNSQSDAADFDYSDVLVESLIVEGAGNDCLDLSGGNYSIRLDQAR